MTSFLAILFIITAVITCICLPVIAVFSVLQWREMKTLRTGKDVFSHLAELARKRKLRTDQTVKL